MDTDRPSEPLEDVLPASPAPADEEHPPDSSDEEDDSDEEVGDGNSGANGELAILDADDDLDEGEELRPLEIPMGYVLASSAHAVLTAELVKRPIVLRVGIGWLTGTITRQAQARTRHFYDYSVCRPRRQHKQRELPLSKYSVDSSSGGGLLGAIGVPCPGRWV